MRDDPASRSFRALREEHFDRLCRQLTLTEMTSREGDGFAVVSAAAGNVRVFFEHERGICIFGLGAGTDVRPLCTVDEIAQRFPRTRLMPEGLLRLSPDEQRSFVESHWPELQRMFAPEYVGETRKWHAALVAANNRWRGP
jgi:hypothetical protein